MRPTILFDMNGILIDDEDLHLLAFRQVMAENDLRMTTADYSVFFAGRTDHDGLQGFLIKYSPSLLDAIDDLVERKSRCYQGFVRSGKLKSYPGASELVNQLRSRSYELAVVTSSARREAETVLEFLNLTAAFKVIVAAEDIVTGKPAPDPYREAAIRLGRLPNGCIAIEDSPSGVRSAKAAGIFCIAVASTHKIEELQDADIVAGTLRDLSQTDFDTLIS